MVNNIIGQRFGKLLVLEVFLDDKKRKMCECVCDCGTFVAVEYYHLCSGHTKSCGCLRKDVGRSVNKKHGLTGKRIYYLWCAMKRRCNNQSAANYELYGGRGIRVCSTWNDFEKFLDWAIENGYKDSLSLDRIDSNGDYEPSNCRWVTTLEQANNRRNNRYVEYNNEVHTISEWSRITGIRSNTLWARLFKHHWPVEKALTTKVSKK